MLEGIHILNKTVITEQVIPNENLFQVVGVIFLISFILTLAGIHSDNGIFGVIAIICAISFITSIVLLASVKEIETDRYRYEVTIDESVLFSDIYEKYEVVEQRGEIWVLEDKKYE